MSAHTPEWAIVNSPRPHGSVDELRTNDEKSELICEFPYGADSEYARLIAAAPELLEALRAMERCPGYYLTDPETGETFDTIALAAIANATGAQA